MRPPVVTAPRSLSYYGAVPDLGLAYVAAAARAAGHDVTVIDAPGLALDESRPLDTDVGRLAMQGLQTPEIVARIPPDVQVVGFANMFLHEWGVLRELIAAVKRARPGAVTVAGGENASAYWGRMLDECAALDLIVCGEGEAAFVELLARIEAGRSLDDAPSVARRHRDGPVANPRRARIDDVDGLARPAWDLFPIGQYLERGLGSGVERGPAMPVLTSRGCPYRCTFCSSPQMWTTRYRRRDPDDVVDEIADLQTRYGVRNVNINDLTSLLTKAWILEFCRAMQRRGLNVTWQLPSGTRSEAVDAEAARAMYAAGCRNFCYAPESGAPTELTRMRKRVKLPALRTSLQASLDAGMVTHASIILGTPEQTPDELLETWKFVHRLALDGLHSVGVMVFAPYPGSALYRELDAAGRIEHDDAYRYGSLLRAAVSGDSYREGWSRRRLTTIQFAMLASFYLTQFARRPGRMLQSARNLLRGREHTILEQLVHTKLAGFRPRDVGSPHRYQRPRKPNEGMM